MVDTSKYGSPTHKVHDCSERTCSVDLAWWPEVELASFLQSFKNLINDRIWKETLRKPHHDYFSQMDITEPNFFKDSKGRVIGFLNKPICMNNLILNVSLSITYILPAAINSLYTCSDPPPSGWKTTWSIKRPRARPSVHHPTLHTHAHPPGTLMLGFARGLLLLSLLASPVRWLPSPRDELECGRGRGVTLDMLSRFPLHWEPFPSLLALP